MAPYVPPWQRQRASQEASNTNNSYSSRSGCNSTGNINDTTVPVGRRFSNKEHTDADEKHKSLQMRRSGSETLPSQHARFQGNYNDSDAAQGAASGQNWHQQSSSNSTSSSSRPLGGLRNANTWGSKQDVAQSDEADLDVRFRSSMEGNRVSFGGCVTRLTIDEDGPALDDNWNVDDTNGELGRPDTSVPRFLQDMSAASNGADMVQESSRGAGRPSSSFLADRSSIGSECRSSIYSIASEALDLAPSTVIVGKLKQPGNIPLSQLYECPRGPDGEWLSFGSRLHLQNRCTPCKFFRGRRGCRDGVQCKMCHFPHEELTYSGIRKAAKNSALAKRSWFDQQPVQVQNNSVKNTFVHIADSNDDAPAPKQMTRSSSDTALRLRGEAESEAPQGQFIPPWQLQRPNNSSNNNSNDPHNVDASAGSTSGSAILAPASGAKAPLQTPGSQPSHQFQQQQQQQQHQQQLQLQQLQKMQLPPSWLSSMPPTPSTSAGTLTVPQALSTNTLPAIEDPASSSEAHSVSSGQQSQSRPPSPVERSFSKQSSSDLKAIQSQSSNNLAPNSTSAPNAKGSGPIRTKISNKDFAKFDINTDKIMRGEDSRTTVMVRNLVGTKARKDFLKFLERANLHNRFTFFYMPCKEHRDVRAGFAFVNFKSAEDVKTLYGYVKSDMWKEMRKGDPQCKPLAMSYARFQGHEELMTHFSSSVVMHEQDPEKRPLFCAEAPDGHFTTNYQSRGDKGHGKKGNAHTSSQQGDQEVHAPPGLGFGQSHGLTSMRQPGLSGAVQELLALNDMNMPGNDDSMQSVLAALQPWAVPMEDNVNFGSFNKGMHSGMSMDDSSFQAEPAYIPDMACDSILGGSYPVSVVGRNYGV